MSRGMPIWKITKQIKTIKTAAGEPKNGLYELEIYSEAPVASDVLSGHGICALLNSFPAEAKAKMKAAKGYIIYKNHVVAVLKSEADRAACVEAIADVRKAFANKRDRPRMSRAATV